MKKLLTFLTLLTLFFTTAWADEVTFTASANNAGTLSEGAPANLTAYVSGTGYYQNNGWQVTGTQTGIITFRGFISAYKLTGINIIYNTNKNAGLAYASAKLGESSVTSSSTTLQYGGSGDGRVQNYSANLNVTETVFNGEDLVITVAGNTNSVWIVSVTITYADASATPTAVKPTFSPGTGFYDEIQTVTISSTTTGASIRYTMGENPEDPTATTGTLYSGPITVNSTTTIKAIAVAEGYNPSSVETAVYTFPSTVNVPPTYTEDFADGFGDFYTKTITGPSFDVWSTSSYNNTTYAKATAFKSNTNNASESWLYSPYIDLTSATNPKLTFSHAGNFFMTDGQSQMANDVKVMIKVKDNNVWSGWTPLDGITYPDGGSYTFTDVEKLMTSYKGKIIQIGFKYTSTTDRAGTWEITDFKVENVAAYSITVTQPASGGTISASAANADANDLITITATPDAGYELTAVTVTPSESGVNAPEVTIGGNTATFNMPASNVTVTATFSKIWYTIACVNTPTDAANAGNAIWLKGGFDNSNGDRSQVGNEVRIKVHTVTNWQIDNVSVAYTDANGNPATLTPTEGATDSNNEYGNYQEGQYGTWYTFSMPASNITITATFRPYQPDLYLMGNANDQNWSQTYKMNFDSSKTGREYSIRAYYAADHGEFQFEADGHRYASGKNEDPYYVQIGENGDYAYSAEVPLIIDNDKNFRLAPGIYDIYVNKERNKVVVTPVDVEFEFHPAAGTVNQNTEVTVESNLYDLLHAINSSIAETSVTNEVSLDGTSFDESVELATVGSATVTGKASYGHIAYNAEAQYTVQEVDLSNVYTLVESSTDLVAGGEYIIASTKEVGSVYVMGAQNSNNRASVSNTVSLVSNVPAITIGETEAILTLGGSSTDGWSFFDPKYGDNGGYLYAANTSSGDKNYLRSQATNDENGIATITLGESGNAVITFGGDHNGRNTIRFNSASNQLIFSCYASTGQQPVYLYKKATASNYSVTPVITPASQDVIGGKITNVTITPGEGCTTPVEIWYTKDGSDPSYADNENRYQYTAPFTIDVTQAGPVTVKAIAIEEEMEPSRQASVTYNFKKPAKPTFSPEENEVQSGDFTVTIDSENGGSIYYMVVTSIQDEPESADEIKQNGNAYPNDGFTVSGDGKHIVYAVVELNGLFSDINDITYTTIQTSTEPGDWTLVTSVSDIKEGRQYFIVNSELERTVGKHDGTRFKSLPRVNNVVYGPNFETATVTGKDVTIFTFEIEDGNKYMKNAYSSTYYCPGTGSATGISTSNAANMPVYISDGTDDLAGFVIIKGSDSQDETRSFAYNDNGSNQFFGSYKSPHPTSGNNRPIYMYYREVTTLAQIEKSGTLNQKYNVADELIAVEYKAIDDNADANDVYLWCKDQGNASNNFVEAPAPDSETIIDFLHHENAQGQIVGPQLNDWDQSNWVVLKLTGSNGLQKAVAAKGHKITGVTGTYVNDNNYMIAAENDFIVGDDADFTPNTYCVANFNQSNLVAGGVQSTVNGKYYFFMTPKVQEVCTITFAQWNGTAFTVPVTSGFRGELDIDYKYNSADQDIVEAALDGRLEDLDPEDYPTYTFTSVVQLPTAGGAPSLKGDRAGAYKVYPTDLTAETTPNDPVTAINTVSVGNGEVKSVKYVNVAGIVSDTPFQGVNIVVTEYTDGSRTTTKMLRK